MISLRGLGWNHERCTAPLRACTEAWKLLEPGVELVWENRSLMDFGDQPLEEVAGLYDLLVIDYPFCGTAEATGTLVPLDDLLAPELLAALESDAVGPSHASYSYRGRQWGLATDAACQVAAIRADLVDGAPVTWDEVRELARSHPGRVAVPLSPAQAMCAFLTLCANLGSPAAERGDMLADREIAREVVQLLADLYALGPPAALEWEPPEVLARLTTGDELVYVPLTFGYVTYARSCRFLDIPSAGSGPVGSVLGGAGLAVSSTSAHPEEAAAFAAYASGADAQRTLVGPAGGQPGSRTAWDDPELDRAAGGFFSGTLATIEQAWVRPREPWWPAFQLDGGRLLNRALGVGDASRTIVESLDSLYRRRG